MKIDRLIGILSILLQRDTVTAPELAGQFEVSRRTISRDIQTLCQAGIPVMTKQGANGGICIMKNYRIDRTLLTNTEMKDILAGLRFRYYSPSGETTRKIEPYYLIFRWASWYVWGWCTDRKDYRLFKLNRMSSLLADTDTFSRRSVPLPDLRNERIFPGGIRVKALFSTKCKWRLVEEFGSECFTETEDGRLLFHADYTDKENLISWLLTFGDRVTLLDPEEIRLEMREIIRKMSRFLDEQGYETDFSDSRLHHEI